MSKKTNKTERIYDYLAKQWANEKSIPSYREIAKACQMSVSTVTYHLEKLEGEGRIERDTYKSRSIRLVEEIQAMNEDEEVALIYDFIQEQIKRGTVPTQKEIAAGCYLSRTKVRNCLATLEGQQRIVLDQQARGIRLVEI